ncbi:MAG: hypothetical protein QOG70_1868 [Solirubrobacteraceae bacterium]|jgi:uncharacterized protein (TIGR04141 family)|nr:hypothetical protein [Solirubrobacteraceae bacterium]
MSAVASSRALRQLRLTFFLLKEGRAADSVVRGSETLTAMRVPDLGLDREQPNLFVKRSNVSVPRWATRLDQHADGDLTTGLLTASASAVLLIAVPDAEGTLRLIALTFGHGRHLIEPDAIVHDFGLRVVLNTVAYDKIKSVDAKTVDELTRHSRLDVSRDASFGAFGLDVTTDLVRSVTGTTDRDVLAGRLTGSDSLALNSKLDVPEFPALGATLLEAYSEDTYKEHFDFIDHLRTEKDPHTVAALDDALVKALQTRELDRLHLAVPEPVDWLQVAGFRFSSSRRDDAADLDSDPRISVYLPTRENDLSLDRVKQDRVEAMRADDDSAVYGTWPVYRCVVFETNRNGQLYTLTGGQWYRVSLSFQQQVNDYADALPRLDLDLPDADDDCSEAQYIAKAVAATGALSLDQQLARDSVPTPVEICDMLTTTGQLIHVKKRGRSSTLSHLFAQGLVSAELLLQSQEFRTEARRKAADLDTGFAEVLPADAPARDAHEVSYVIITRGRHRPDAPLTLPFFSVVNLRAAAQRLYALGFKVSVAEVREQ